MRCFFSIGYNTHVCEISHNISGYTKQKSTNHETNIIPPPEPLRRDNGKFATPAQKAIDEAKKWKRAYLYLLSVQTGAADRIRRLTEENIKLKQLLK
jgi:hypothetical protein